MGKAKHRITHRPEYNQSLRNRNSLTFWVDEAVISIMVDGDAVFSSLTKQLKSL
jgi:hypothetical protein